MSELPKSYEIIELTLINLDNKLFHHASCQLSRRRDIFALWFIETMMVEISSYEPLRGQTASHHRGPLSPESKASSLGKYAGRKMQISTSLPFQPQHR